MELLFPYSSQRTHQDELVKAVLQVCEKKKHLLVHAPTGLGKTAASLGPALTVALKEGLTVFFLTARHTQHLLALKTVHDIEKQHNIKIPVLDLIGKKWLCLQPGAERLYSNEFVEYCRAMREDKACSYYENLKKGTDLSPRAKAALNDLSNSDSGTQALMNVGRVHQVCPYEIAVLHGRDAKVIIADYSYVFNEGIRTPFFAKIGKELEKSIIIVDEAHNLPERVKDLASVRISTFSLRRAQQEGEKHGYDFHDTFKAIERVLASKKEESYMQKDDLIVADSIIQEMTSAGDHIREEHRASFIGSIAAFLDEWKKEQEGFARILTPDFRTQDATLSYRCLDPGVITGPVFEQAASTVIMSGTLTPTQMYIEILDMPVDTKEITLPSPFPVENRLVLVVPKTSTKYTSRSPEQYATIGTMVADMVNRIPGNSIIFFPSYDILESVKITVTTQVRKTLFQETPGLSKDDREALLEKFKQYHETGAALLAVTTGSFGEGVDLPGDYLKAVVIVGLPLQKPTKEVEALIAYYDKKFGRGWDYGYVVPAFNRVLQSAGRTIRTMTDRGAIIFLDERYAWPQYTRLFPPEWSVKTTILYQKHLEDFFAKK
jgi:DNA excision repair protein ERCC-2